MTHQAQQADEDARGGVILSPEEVAELELAVAEAEEDDRAGRLIAIGDVLAKLGRDPCDRCSSRASGPPP